MPDTRFCTSLMACPELASYQRRFRSSVAAPELDDKVAGEVLRLNLAALFLPQPQQSGLILTHDSAGVRTADEVSTVPSAIFSYDCFHESPRMTDFS